MPDVHTIRLRGPWQMQPIARFATAEAGRAGQRDDDLPSPMRVKLPATCEAALPSDFCGRVRFTRRFQRPTGVEQHEMVYLVVETPWTIVALTLNDCPLETAAGDTPPARWNVTDRLADTNLLTIEVEYPPEPERTTAGRATAGQASSATPQAGSATPEASSATPQAGSATLLGEVRLEIVE